MSNHDTISDLAAEIDANGFRGRIRARDGREIRVDAPAGRFHGAAIAGCLCSFLDEMGVCRRNLDCPSASTHHFMLEDRRDKGGNTFFKLCPVLFSDVTGAFAMHPHGGVA